MIKLEDVFIQRIINLNRKHPLTQPQKHTKLSLRVVIRVNGELFYSDFMIEEKAKHILEDLKKN